jgi:hypothetical protein
MEANLAWNFSRLKARHELSPKVYDVLMPDTTCSKRMKRTDFQIPTDGIPETFALSFSFADQRRPSQDTSPFIAVHL